MRKLLFVLIGGSMLYVGCQKNDRTAKVESTDDVVESPTQRLCAADEIMQAQNADPSIAQARAEIESFTHKILSDPTKLRLLADGTIEIPVVVNVLYRTSAENVSDAQIASQITALNKDYGATNSDYNNTPSLFQGARSGNTGIKFVLDQTIRKSTTKRSWRLNDDMKKANKGGIAPTSPTTKLNLWVCVLSSGYLGYAQFPGGPAATDGVVITTSGFGTTGTARAPFNLGRTATHEVGHWLNLRHIWGDATCGSDLVGDTPTHNTANYGCPGYPHYSTCSGTPVEMTMNYMDYTDDACMYMFSAGQKSRMLATFAAGGPRASFAQP